MYIVTDLMSASLWDIVRSPRGRSGMVDMGRIAGYLVGAAAGLGHLHAHGVVHVDVSLKNVLVDEHHCAKLCDLGTAHSAQSFLGWQPVTTGGTPGRRSSGLAARSPTGVRTRGPWA